LGYDNAEGKGHHRHSGTLEEAYKFMSLKKLSDDFIKDMEVLYTIRTQKPPSIHELSRMLNRDVKNIAMDVKNEDQKTKKGYYAFR
jgi:predicted transcriptional regulator